MHFDLCDIDLKLINVKYSWFQRGGFSLDPSPDTEIEATFTPDGQYVVSGSYYFTDNKE